MEENQTQLRHSWLVLWAVWFKELCKGFFWTVCVQVAFLAFEQRKWSQIVSWGCQGLWGPPVSLLEARVRRGGCHVDS